MRDQHNSHIPSVVIVGGGTAGWMTAAYLSQAFGDEVSVVLVESPEIGRVGVGEATFSSIKAFFDFLGLAEQDWMPHCDATYKMGIRFAGWNADGRDFYHPFERASSADGIPLAEWWVGSRKSLSAYDYSCFLTPTVCDLKRSPRHLDGRVFDERVQHLFDGGADRDASSAAEADGTYPYAYHFDADKLAGFMADYAQQRGAVRIEDLVVDVKLRRDGSIESLTTNDHGRLAADLYIDCTGFRGLLINQALEEPFESFEESLLCDQAIAMRIPHERSDQINPFTTATALSAGWVWDIPLFSRTGTGYVYSSQFLDADEAERELRDHLGERAIGVKCSHIPMRVGRNRNSWVKNCVAIGLSSGFVEPLESTGIFFIQHAIEELINHFPQPDSVVETARTAYNRAINDCIDGVRDFLVLHYRLSDRRDSPFWQAVEGLSLSEAGSERLSTWRDFAPTTKSVNTAFHGFQAYSYTAMLFGLNYVPEQPRTRVSLRSDRQAQQVFERIADKAAQLGSTLPTHYEYLTRLREDAFTPAIPEVTTLAVGR